MRIWTLAAGCLLFASTWAQAEHHVDFSEELYQQGETVVGKGGWEARIPNGGPRDESARVAAVRWDSERPALVIKGASIKNSRLTLPAAAQSYKVSFEIAFNFRDGDANFRQFRLGLSRVPFSEIFFSADANGGFGFQGEGTKMGSGHIAIPKHEILRNSFYRFSAEVDFLEGTYSVTVTGEKNDGSSVNYQSGPIAFEQGSQGSGEIGSLYLVSSDASVFYIRDFKVE